MLPPDRCGLGCEVYMSVRPQVGAKEGACMAARGDEASIVVFGQSWNDETVPAPSLYSQLDPVTVGKDNCDSDSTGSS